MRTVLAILALLVSTLLCGIGAIAAALLRVPDRGDPSWYDLMHRWWARAVLWAAGVEVVLHGDQHRGGPRQVFVANHVSRFDVLVLAAHLSRFKFVAKAELARIPFFGAAARAGGTVYIERDKRKSAFESYREAARRIGEGASVVVFAEGTRGDDYALRPFKKGPFVLAISAGARIVPTVVHGGLHVHPRGTVRVRSGRIDVHFLEPVPVAGLTFDDRNRLAVAVRGRMAALLREQYGIASPPLGAARGPG